MPVTCERHFNAGFSNFPLRHELRNASSVHFLYSSASSFDHRRAAGRVRQSDQYAATMARRIPTANGAVNGMHTNVEAPPPSTLAAQIVQNQQKPRSQQDATGVTLTNLLHELLHNPEATPETDVEVNVQLIYVLTEAGINKVVTDNPFARWDQLTHEATDSISVIQKTIERQPEALLEPVATDGPPVALWLLPRLLAVCGRRNCQSLPISRLLDTTLCLLSSSTDTWQHARLVRQMYQDCADGT